MTKILTGLENIISHVKTHEALEGKVGYLCHSASVTSDYTHGALLLKKLLGERLTCLFGPQHGLVTDVQDNMIETNHYMHPYFNLPVFSLYSETRQPTKEMFENIDTLLVDLQDVGTRIYTYIYTLSLAMKRAKEWGKKIVVLDRPNPIGGEKIEGNILENSFKSFVGLHPLPVRHGLTIGEFARWIHKDSEHNCELEVIPMLGWKRSMQWNDTGLPWVPPSPNLPTAKGCLTFPATVLLEGTNISEGRGTTLSLEILGHPKIEPFKWSEKLNKRAHDLGLEGFVLRPLIFHPMHQKHRGKACGGVHIHPLDTQTFQPWLTGQWLIQELYRELGSDFQWKAPPYEYVQDKMPIDIINGSDFPRKWVEGNGSLRELEDWSLLKSDNYNQEIKEVFQY